MTHPAPLPQPTPAGWYPSPTNPNVMQWWDGQQWTVHTAPAATTPAWVQPNVRQAMDRAQYVRNQHGHSLVLHLLFGWLLLYIPTIYFAVSPNHYFHA